MVTAADTQRVSIVVTKRPVTCIGPGDTGVDTMNVTTYGAPITMVTSADTPKVDISIIATSRPVTCSEGDTGFDAMTVTTDGANYGDTR